MKVRAHIYVSGIVQGVFYRSETRDVAQARNVKGWVRNLRDGRVEAVFEGEKPDVEAVLAFCRKGPPGAHVTALEVEWEEWKEEFKDFKIVY